MLVFNNRAKTGIMAKTKETQIEDLNETLMAISEELGNICKELSELNSGLSTLGCSSEA
jgi:hypothetical protein